MRPVWCFVGAGLGPEDIGVVKLTVIYVSMGMTRPPTS